MSELLDAIPSLTQMFLDQDFKVNRARFYPQMYVIRLPYCKLKTKASITFAEKRECIHGIYSRFYTYSHYCRMIVSDLYEIVDKKIIKAKKKDVEFEYQKLIQGLFKTANLYVKSARYVEDVFELLEVTEELGVNADAFLKEEDQEFREIYNMLSELKPKMDESVRDWCFYIMYISLNPPHIPSHRFHPDDYIWKKEIEEELLSNSENLILEDRIYSPKIRFKTILENLQDAPDKLLKNCTKAEFYNFIATTVGDTSYEIELRADHYREILSPSGLIKYLSRGLNFSSFHLLTIPIVDHLNYTAQPWGYLIEDYDEGFLLAFRPQLRKEEIMSLVQILCRLNWSFLISNKKKLNCVLNDVKNIHCTFKKCPCK